MGLRLLLAAFLAAAAPLQDGSDAAATAPPDAAAATAWERVLRASRAGGAGEPIRAFRLKAEVLTRDGVQTNEARVEHAFLEPDHVRFALPGGRETGRGPGSGQRAYWLRDGDEVVVLQGREFAEDRRLVDDMLAVSRNYVALSDPARVEPERLELLAGPPPGLPPALAAKARRLEWLRVESRDFALFGAERASGTAAPLHVVDLGLQPGSWLPLLALVRERRPDAEPGPPARRAPMLLELDRYRPTDGFLVPHAILVRRLGEGGFEEKPAQEIWVERADLRPPLAPEDFGP